MAFLSIIIKSHLFVTMPDLKHEKFNLSFSFIDSDKNSTYVTKIFCYKFMLVYVMRKRNYFNNKNVNTIEKN